MRTHFLNELAISGREKALALEPEFDFHRAKRVLNLELDVGDKPGAFPSLRLDLVYEGNEGRSVLALLFEGVRYLVLPEMAPSLLVPELEIEDLRDRMMEGLRFEVISHYERAFRCTCGNLSILSFEPA